jgi:RimJ/RimL family protein N-acetyltransferase
MVSSRMGAPFREVSMPPAPVLLETPRLKLRRWLPSDLEPFAAINADPRVMEFLPTPLDRAASDAMVARMESHFDEHGFGLWCVEIKGGVPCAGFIGLSAPDFEMPFTPCVEIGWRLSPETWGKGYATEGAREVLRHGFETLGLEEILSWTTVANTRSRRVMEKLGMSHDPKDDFLHPCLPEGHPLRPHVLYRIKASGFEI